MIETTFSSRRTRTWFNRISFASAAPIADFAGRFLRTIILSRMLLPAEFGTSVALTVVIGTAAMISDVGLHRFVLMGPEGEASSRLAAAHAVQLLCGLLIAAAMLAVARPAAAFFDIPRATPSFMLAALIPLIHAWANLGPKQAQRAYNFRADAAVNVAASACSVLLAFPAVLLTHDCNAILVCLIGSEIVYVLASHVMSPRPYQIIWDRRVVSDAMRYGLPLTLNGFGLAMFAQADRALVGTTFGVETLASYSVIASLAIAAMSPFLAIWTSLCVSILVRHRSNAERFPHLLMAIIWGFALFSLLYSTGVGLGLDLIVPAVFGARYTVAPGIRILFALIVLVRILRGPSTVLLLVDGETARLTLSNLVGGAGLAIAFLLVHIVPSLTSVLFGILIGDLLSLALLGGFLMRGAAQLRRKIRDVAAFECLIGVGLCLALAASAKGLGGRVPIALACAIAGAWMARQIFAAIKRDDGCESAELERIQCNV